MSEEVARSDAGNDPKSRSKGFSPFADLLGLHFSELRPGFSRCELDAAEHMFNPNGILHGGVIFSMADTGMGAALHVALDAGRHCATIEIKIVYLRPVRRGRLVCDTTLVQKGKRIAVLESEVKNGDKLVAKALGTFAIIEST